MAKPAASQGAWHDLDESGDLWQAIDQHFQGADDGEYYALTVTVKRGGAPGENPISGYAVVKVSAPRGP